MLRRLKKNKKGFTLMEILVAVTILGIIVGPLLASLFSNNRVIEQARKQTEATYVAKKVMEETLAEYYSNLSTINGKPEGGQTLHINQLKELLNNNSTGNVYKSDEDYPSKYADDFIYSISIVPSGKIGMGGAVEEDTDSTANYLHIYRDVIDGREHTYIVLPDGSMTETSLDSSNNFDITLESDFSVSYNDNVIATSGWNAAKKDLRIAAYSSNDAVSRTLYITASSSWDNDCERYFINYTSKNNDSNTKVNFDTDFIDDSKDENDDYIYRKNYYSSNREQWDIALYEITVTVYENGSTKPLSSAQGVIEVKIFA